MPTPTAEQVNQSAAWLVRHGVCFGDKVFVCDLATAIGAPLSTVKAALMAYQTAGTVSMARADCVELLDPAKVTASLCERANASFHFVRAPAQ